jgi:ribose 5-phosphate isomerase RpiB
MNKTIVLATDHAGFELKEHVKRFLIAENKPDPTKEKKCVARNT